MEPRKATEPAISAAHPPTRPQPRGDRGRSCDRVAGVAGLSFILLDAFCISDAKGNLDTCRVRH